MTPGTGGWVTLFNQHAMGVDTPAFGGNRRVKLGCTEEPSSTLVTETVWCQRVHLARSFNDSLVQNPEEKGRF